MSNAAIQLGVATLPNAARLVAFYLSSDRALGLLSPQHLPIHVMAVLQDHDITMSAANVSIRLGVLLVLDLATPCREGAPHLTSLFEMRQVRRYGASQPRLILIIKVPGRRKRPSDLTKLAKTKRE